MMKKTVKMKNKMDEILAYLIEVDKDTGEPFKGYLSKIPNDLKFLQSFVDFGGNQGLIQVVNIRGIDIICHDEGKLRYFPYSRVVLDDDNSILDVFAGNLICVRADYKTGEFISIQKEDIPIINQYLKPAVILPIDNIVVKLENDWLQKRKIEDMKGKPYNEQD